VNRIPRSAWVTLFVITSLFAWAAVAPAQTITGTVTGAGHPIVGATARLLDLDRIEHTGAKGEFTFAHVPRGKYKVFAGVIGFASATRVVEVAGETTTLSFELKVSAIPLEEVVVSASPYPRTADDLYQSAESKSQVDFLNSAGENYSEKISDLPGVAVRGNGSAPNRPILRGLSDNRVLILENGLRTGDIATYDPAHATPIEAIGVSQVDVVRGPASILYGPSTIGGLVNVITNIVPSVSDRRLSGTVALEGNSVSDQAAGFFNTVISDGHQAFRISAGGLHSNDIRIPSGTYTDPASGAAFDLDRMPQTFDHSHEEGLGYSYQSDFGMIGIGGKHYEMNYGITGVPPNSDWIDVPPATSRIAQSRNTFELHGLFNGGSSWIKRWKLDANYNDYNHSEFPTAQDSTGVSDPQANHFHKRAFNGALQLQHASGGKVQGTIGVWTNIEDLTIDGDQPLGPNSLTSGFAAYAFEELQATDRARLQAGARFDYNRIQTHPAPMSTDSVFQSLDVSRLTNAATASLGLIQRFTSGLTGSLSLARSFRAPTVQELFANGLDAASGTYSIGTSDLGAETGFGVDASLKGNFANGAFEISPYANIIHDYIYAFLRGDTIQAFPVRKFAATDARLMGFEASVMVQVAKSISLRASSDYVNAEDTKLNVPLPFTPPLRGLVRATYEDGKYMGMVEWRGAADQNRLGDGDTPTKGYGILNLGTGVRIAQEGWVHNISVHCDNVFDRVYRDHTSVVKDFLPQPGRGFRLNYELQF
jgi:iron complex outermembrane recepter protein